MKPTQQLETAIVAYLNANDADLPAGMVITRDIDAQTITRPFVAVVAGNTEEHEVLRGVYTGEVLVIAESNARDSDVPAADVLDLAGELYHLLADIPAVLTFANAPASGSDDRAWLPLTVYDVRCSEPQTERDESVWRTQISLPATFAPVG